MPRRVSLNGALKIAEFAFERLINNQDLTQVHLLLEKSLIGNPTSGFFQVSSFVFRMNFIVSKIVHFSQVSFHFRHSILFGSACKSTKCALSGVNGQQATFLVLLQQLVTGEFLNTKI